jgi:hypothetical protein
MAHRSFIEFNRCFDFGYNLIYLEINQLLGETFILRLYAEIESEKDDNFTTKRIKMLFINLSGCKLGTLMRMKNRVNDLLRMN